MYSKEDLLTFKTKKMVIYKITNLVNGKIYIGQTTRTFNQRYTGRGEGVERLYNMYDKDSTKVKNEHLFSSIQKYGSNNFKVEIIKECKTEDELNYYEKYYIELFDSANYKKGYNIQLGGDNKKWSTKRRLEKMKMKKEQIEYFIEKIEQKIFTKEEVFYGLNARTVYIQKGASKKKYFIYPTLKDCCNEHEVNIIDGYNMAMRFKTNDKKFIRVNKSKFEIHFETEIEFDGVYENRYHKQSPTKKKQTPKNRKKSKVKPQVKTCSVCGKVITSVVGVCADCKRKKEEEKNNANREKKICLECGKEHYRGNSPYCSNNCANKARNKRKNKKKEES